MNHFKRVPEEIGYDQFCAALPALSLIPLGVSNFVEGFQTVFGLPQGGVDEHSWTLAFIGHNRNELVAPTAHLALMEYSVLWIF